MALQILELRGEWARVQAENGWQGWTGTRYLLPRAGGAARQPAPSGPAR